jgi:hypothetical protein
MNIDFAVALVRAGIITPEQFVTLIETQLQRQIPVACLAIRADLLTMRQVGNLWADAESSERSFGEMAIERRYLSEAQLGKLVALQNACVPSIEQLVVELGFLGAGLVRVLSQALAITGPDKTRRSSLPKPKFSLARADAARLLSSD